jgi:dihydroflavonol-4-reductase
MKTVGIIGGAGFIGSYLTKSFLSNGFEVKVSATDISREDKNKHLKKLEFAENLKTIQMDVTNKTAFGYVCLTDIAAH